MKFKVRFISRRVGAAEVESGTAAPRVAQWGILTINLVGNALRRALTKLRCSA